MCILWLLKGDRMRIMCSVCKGYNTDQREVSTLLCTDQRCTNGENLYFIPPYVTGVQVTDHAYHHPRHWRNQRVTTTRRNVSVSTSAQRHCQLHDVTQWRHYSVISSGITLEERVRGEGRGVLSTSTQCLFTDVTHVRHTRHTMTSPVCDKLRNNSSRGEREGRGVLWEIVLSGLAAETSVCEGLTPSAH